MIMKNVRLLLPFILFALTSQAQEVKPNYIPQTVIVKFKPKNLKSNMIAIDTSKDKLQTFINSLQPTSVKKKFPHATPPSKPNDVDITTIYEIKYSKDYPVERVATYLASFGDVQYAQPLYSENSNSLYTPNDPSFGTQWYLNKINIQLAWDKCKGDTNVVIGISDTGVDIFHEDLSSQIKYNWADPIDGIDNDGDGYIDNFRGWDLMNNDNNPDYSVNTANYGHGTSMAGISSAKVNNAKGIAGVGFNCKMLPVRGSSYDAIMYLAEHGSSIINCSWEDGLRQALPLYQDYIDYATFNKNALVVCAAGNTERQIFFYPASYNHAISVAATTETDQVWTPTNGGCISGSTYGFKIAASAPGVSIYTTNAGNSYIRTYCGTSLSSPIFAGIAGLVRSYYPSYSALQAGEQVRVTADNIDTIAFNAPYKKLLGHGRVNALNALTDSLKPSIRLVDYSITGLYDDLVRGGDTAILKGSFVNYLHKVKNITVSISDYNGYFAQVEPGRVIDSLGMMDTLKNFELRFSLKKTIPYDATVALQITYDLPNGFHDVQFVTMSANPSYLPLIANNISTSVTSVGSIGTAFVSNIEGLGFQYKNSPLLYNGIPTSGGKNIYNGLVLAKDTGEIILNYGSSSDFTTETYPDYVTTDSSISIVSSYNGRYKTNVDFNFKINQRATSWLKDSSFVIYEYDIINKSFNVIDSMYAGLIMDWGVSNPFLNKAEVNVYKKYGYVYSIEQNQPYVGIKVLKGDSINHYLIEVSDTAHELINVKDFNGFSKVDIFNGLTHSKTKLSLTNNTADDIIQMINIKAKNIKIGDTLHVAFALFVASKEQNIQSVVSRAEYRYKQSHGDTTNSKEIQISKLKLIPNITSGSIVTASFEALNKGMCTITISNNEGKTVKEIYQAIETGNNTITISGIKQAGMYYVTVKLKDYACTEKFIKQ
jgi:serine protease